MLHPMRLGLSLTIVAAVVLACSETGAADTVVLLDGSSASGTVQAITANGQIQGPNLPPGLKLDDLQTIVREGAPPGAAGEATAVVLLAEGGRWPVRTVTLADDKLSVESAVEQPPLSLPLEAARGVVFSTAEPAAEIAKALAAPDPQHDRLFIKTDDQVQSLTGLVERITAEGVEFTWDKQKHHVPRQKVLAVVLAGSAKTSGARFLVSAGETASAAATAITLDGGKCAVQTAGGGRMELPWSVVTKVQIRSDRVAFLSEREPVEARQETIVAPARSWQKDRSVAGGPLKLGGKSFDRGLGVQARSELVFAADGKFAQLLTTVGIDSETNGRGDCVGVVLADGVELWRQRVKGGEAARELKLDITGKRRITLLVEPGEELDLADHFDWANARFLKAAN